ncbi:hypothetical protein [Cohnella sp. CFH 77786]|uniref:hypothetical protein n=1 Tax=Cohnella sp. CFH 77786 TaxID=2662265 RepID=UPI001C608964|nr:hypothetical protein [Cohnella sp. CFH 77786]
MSTVEIFSIFALIGNGLLWLLGIYSLYLFIKLAHRGIQALDNLLGRKEKRPPMKPRAFKRDILGRHHDAGRGKRDAVDPQNRKVYREIPLT